MSSRSPWATVSSGSSNQNRHTGYAMKASRELLNQLYSGDGDTGLLRSGE
jgi:hypothetical protein